MNPFSFMNDFDNWYKYTRLWAEGRSHHEIERKFFKITFQDFCRKFYDANRHEIHKNNQEIDILLLDNFQHDQLRYRWHDYTHLYTNVKNFHSVLGKEIKVVYCEDLSTYLTKLRVDGLKVAVYNSITNEFEVYSPLYVAEKRSYYWSFNENSSNY